MPARKDTETQTFANLIVKHATDSMVFTDADGLTLWANAPFEKMSGYSVDEVRGRKPGSVLQGPDTNAATVADISAAIKARRSIRTELLNYAKDGTPYWIDLTITPVFDDGGTLTHFMSIERDITESKSLAKKTSDALAEEKARKRERTVLSNMSEWLFAAQTMEELQAVVTKSMARLFPQASGELFIYSNSRDVLDRVSAWGGQESEPHLHPDQCWALRRGRAYSYGTSEIDFPCDHVAHPENAYFCLPIIAHGNTIGLMSMTFPNRVGDDHDAAALEQELEPQYELATICAEQISLAAANVRLQTELQDRSVKDTLTGLWNRRWFLDMASRQLRAAQAEGTELSLVMLDADHFKKFNDLHGHDAGDAVLQVLASNLSDIAGDLCFPCRIGGEEFAILCPRMDASQAADKVQDLRMALASARIVHAGAALPNVKVSAGIAQHVDGDTLETLMKRADLALYRAKEAGRDRVELAEPELQDRRKVKRTG